MSESHGQVQGMAWCLMGQEVRGASASFQADTWH